MPHVLVAGKLHPSGIALLDAAPGVTYDYVEEVSESSYAPYIGKADGLVIRTQPLSSSTVARAGRLKVVSRHGVGYDSVDLASLNERGIALAVVGDVNSVSVAEHAMMLLLAAAKRTRQADGSVRSGDWSWRNRLEPIELSGKNLLIVGYGRIGRHLARMAAGFGMVIKAHDPLLEKQGWPQGAVAPEADLNAALAWADAVSVHVPKGDRSVIGIQELAAIKPSAIVVNTARGGAIDEDALVVALRDGRIAAAGIDVFEDEPPSRDNPLFAFNQVILTPHNAALTLECGARMAVTSVQNVLDFFGKRIDPALIVNGTYLEDR
jgi:D-3-phosphoglycerate dehydrogenase / 2-oxoglutarate reductase